MSHDYKDSMGRWISLLNRHCHAYITKHLKDYNLGCGQFSFLLILYDNNGISQDSLSELLYIDKGTTAKAVKKLEEEGYIRREVDSDDRRAYKLYPTEKALELQPHIHEVLDNCNRILSMNFTEEEKELAIRLLRKASKNAINFLKE
jgi:DNA-binding MarR family transcriptional regulator